MKIFVINKFFFLLALTLSFSFTSFAQDSNDDEDETKAYQVYEQMQDILDGKWVLSHESKQTGTTSYKNPAIAFLVGTDATAVAYKTIGKGATLQEDLLPDTKKQMVTMYFCNHYLNCTQLKATHYCAKRNNPEFILNEKLTTKDKIVFDCNMNTPLCNSDEDHVHQIILELSNNNTHLKSSYLGWTNQRPNKKNSIYHFDKR